MTILLAITDHRARFDWTDDQSAPRQMKSREESLETTVVTSPRLLIDCLKTTCVFKASRQVTMIVSSTEHNLKK